MGLADTLTPSGITMSAQDAKMDLHSPTALMWQRMSSARHSDSLRLTAGLSPETSSPAAHPVWACWQVLLDPLHLEASAHSARLRVPRGLVS